MVIWIIGLSSAGKTEIGKHLYSIWKKEENNTVLVDGDEIRAIFKHNQGDHAYSVEGRRENAMRICELCLWLDRQDINVVCCILSIFEENRQWNRQHFSKYYEVYISVQIDVLLKRDKKNIYAPAIRGETKNVVGIDIPFKPPEYPDYILDNNEDEINLYSVAIDIFNKSKQQ